MATRMLDLRQRRTGLGLVAAWSAVAAFLAVAPMCWAAPAPRDSVLDRPFDSSANPTSWYVALSDLARRSSIALLADGSPHRAQAAVGGTGTVKDALDRLGQAFDYTWSAANGKVVTLIRRFDAPEERPQFLATEVLQTARDLLVVLPDARPAPTHDVWSSMFGELAATLTAEQAIALRGGRAIAFGELAPAQQQMARQILDTRKYGVARGQIEALVCQLEGLSGATIEVLDPTGSSDGVRPGKLAYATLIGRDRAGRACRTQVGVLDPGGPFLIVPERRDPAGGDRDQDASQPAPAPTGPAAASAANPPVDTVVSLWLGATTVEGVVRELSAQMGVPVTAPACSRGRRLTVYAKNVPARQILDALASLEGWTWRERKGGACELARAPAVRPSEPAALPRALQAVMPTDLRRYLRLGDPAKVDPLKVSMSPPPRFDGLQGAKDGLMLSLAPRLSKLRSIGYGRLSAGEQEDLLCLLALAPWKDTTDLAAGGFGIPSMSPAKTHLVLQQDTVLCMEMVIDRAAGLNVAFGAAVPQLAPRGPGSGGG